MRPGNVFGTGSFNASPRQFGSLEFEFVTSRCSARTEVSNLFVIEVYFIDIGVCVALFYFDVHNVIYDIRGTEFFSNQTLLFRKS